jgi:hypothetical protein
MTKWHPVGKAAAVACAVATLFIPVAHAAEVITRSSDGRVLVQLKDALIALPEESPVDTQIAFHVAVPPGTSPFHFHLTDLVRDPGRYASRLRLSEWSSVSAGTSVDHPREIIGVPVVKGVNRVGFQSGVDKFCEAWKPEWARLREAAANAKPDEYGWIRADAPKSSSSTFIKFLGDSNRDIGRYYGLACDFAGGCSVSACHNGLTAFVSFFSSNKIQGEDYAVKNFDQQIASGIKVLEHMLVGGSVDISQP